MGGRDSRSRPDDSTFDDEGEDFRRPRRSGGALPWFLVLLLLAVGGGFFYLFHEPQRHELSRVQRDLSEATKEAGRVAGRLSAIEERLGNVESERDQLLSERNQLRDESGRLASTVEEREAEIARLQIAQSSLEERLEEEIRRGEILVQTEGGELKVKLADQILFGPGEAALKDNGRNVLRRVAETLVELEDHFIEVGGHTDTTPLSPRAQERFATNWELSAARATNVVRFLQDSCEIPGARLVATGYSEYRPVASNRGAAGRRRNRRIELTLRPRGASEVEE